MPRSPSSTKIRTARHRRRHRLPLVFLLTASVALSALSASCKDGARIDALITGSYILDDCQYPELVWQPGFGAMKPGNHDEGVIKIQARTGVYDAQDHLAINVRDLDWLRQRLGQTLELEPPRTDGMLNATMNLHGRCPDTRSTSTFAVGEIVFEEFEGRIDTQVHFRANFDLVDARDPDRIIGEDIDADVEFRIRSFPPYQVFNDVF